MKEVSASEPLWERESKPFWAWGPSLSLIASIRSYARYREARGPYGRLMKTVAVIRHRFWSAVTGADIPLGTEIGGGVHLPHPNGIVIHPRVRIGPNCNIFQQVTIGTRNGLPPPRIGGHVDIGAGAKILGDITIGDHVRIGANSVVLQDVPTGKTAVGIPAKVID